jgi:hypothetical protein
VDTWILSDLSIVTPYFKKNIKFKPKSAKKSATGIARMPSRPRIATPHFEKHKIQTNRLIQIRLSPNPPNKGALWCTEKAVYKTPGKQQPSTSAGPQP